MRHLTLKRVSETYKTTQGVLIDDEGFAICCTVENSPLRIPAGHYHVVPHVSPTQNKRLKGKCFKLMNVPDRTDILIHIANLPSELLGCIAPGLSFGAMNGEDGVFSSTNAMKVLLNEFVDGFVLTVRECGYD